MPAKLWCDHAEGFESGLGAWETACRRLGTCVWNCVGRCSQTHSDDEYGTDFSQEQFTVGNVFEQCRSSSSCCNGVIDPETLSRIRPCHLEMEQVQMMTRCKSTLFREVRERTKGKNQYQRGNRTISTIKMCKNCGKLGHWAKDCWHPSGGACDNSAYRNTGKGKSKNTKGKGKHVDVVETEQLQPSETASTVLYTSQDPSVVGELSCISNGEPWIMGVTVNSVSSIRRQAGAEYLLLDTGAQLHASPVKFPGQKIPLLDPGILTASGGRLKHDGGRLVTNKLPEGLTSRVLFHGCAGQKPNFWSLGCLPQQEYWSDLRADTGALFFPDKIQTKRSQT